MARLGVPIVACVIGEGGSGGAIAIALADRVLMQENAIYSVISPEGCASILWRDAGEARKAAAAFKPDAAHCLELGVIDGIVPEPPAGPRTTGKRPRGSSTKHSARPSKTSKGSPARSSCAAGGPSSGGWAFSRNYPAFPGIFHILHRLFPGWNPVLSPVSTPFVNQSDTVCSARYEGR